MYYNPIILDIILMKMSRKSLKMHLEKLLQFQHGDGEKLFETAFE